MKKKDKIKKYKNGGYVRSEEIESGITHLSMDGKGWFEMFAQPLIEEEKKE